MSAAVYHEPYRLPAGILAVAVHSAFFALLYFGFAWQAQPAGTMIVELWQGLPDTVAVQPPRPAVEAAPPPEKVVEPEAAPKQPEKTVEPEIVMPAKKKPAPAPEKKAKAKPEKPARIVEQTERERVEREQAEQAARARTEQAAAAGRVVNEHIGKIVAKIRQHIVMPPDVADDARAEFSVTVLPGGSVLPPRLLKSSGNMAYDNAVERAIIKAQPLPLPSDAALFNKFREMRLGFRPREQE